MEDTRRREEAFDGQVGDSLKKTGLVGGWQWGRPTARRGTFEGAKEGYATVCVRKGEGD